MITLFCSSGYDEMLDCSLTMTDNSNEGVCVYVFSARANFAL